MSQRLIPMRKTDDIVVAVRRWVTAGVHFGPFSLSA
jgi:hypothetical protein